jgi:hypothetical protein
MGGERHQDKNHPSRLIDDAHAGETIVLAKDGKPSGVSANGQLCGFVFLA